MLLGARQFFERRVGGGAPTARDYVQNGLIAMWDGIENAGWGVHDAAATMWKNLVADSSWSDAANPDTTIFANPVWDGNSMSCVDGLNHCLVATTTETHTELSCEIVAQQGAINQYSWAVSCGRYDLTTNRIYEIWKKSNGGGVEVSPQSGGANNMSSSNMAGKWPSFSDVSPHSLSFAGKYSASQNSSSLETFGDGVRVAQITGLNQYDFRNFATAFSKISFANGYSWNNGVGLKNGHIYAVRIYSRALTAAEIAANYAIDKKRLNLP